MPHSDPHFSKYTQHQRIVAFAGAVLGAVLFSNKAILAKLMYREGADALDTITLRMAFAFPLFFALAVASLIPMTSGTSRASLATVSGSMLHPVRPGTL